MAATTVGSPLAVDADLTAESCGEGITRCAVVNPAAMPTDGILTKVRIRGAADDIVLLRIVRPTGPDTYVSAASNRTASGATLSFRLGAAESTHNVRLPVRAGDLLALESRGLPEALGPLGSGTSFGVSLAAARRGLGLRDAAPRTAGSERVA